MARNIHLEVFEKHFKALLSRLQVDDSLCLALMQKGLLNDDRLMQQEADQARTFLESIRNSLQNNNETFMNFLQALSEYVVTEKLANDMYKDIAIFTSELQQQNVQDSAGMYI